MRHPAAIGALLLDEPSTRLVDRVVVDRHQLARLAQEPERVGSQCEIRLSPAPVSEAATLVAVIQQASVARA